MNGTPAPTGRFILLGAVSACLAVGLGAFGQHGLRHLVTPEQVATWGIGAQYHLLHSLGLILAGVVGERAATPRWAVRSGWLLLAGMVCFSGSIYLMVLTGFKLGLVTPLGGLCFMAGWLCLAAAARPKAP